MKQDAPKGLFVAVGANGQRLISPDGASWRAVVGKDQERFRTVAYGDGRFVAAGLCPAGDLLATSRDGVSWETTVKPKEPDTQILGLAYGNGIFLASGGQPGNVVAGPTITTSADGSRWSEKVRISGISILCRFAFGNERFVAVGHGGRRSTSKDGKTWSNAAASKDGTGDALVDVAFGSGAFVGVGLHGLRMCTQDGLKWTGRTAGEEGEHLNSVLWTGDRFVAVGLGATYVSPDGSRWKRLENQNGPLIAAYGNGVFVGHRSKGVLLRSTDGVEWTPIHKADHAVRAIVFGGV
jgi:hypothetical protein